jgi:5'-3' exonuclease
LTAGCDYLASISGIGLKTAHKLLQDKKDAQEVMLFMFSSVFVFFVDGNRHGGFAKQRLEWS